MEIFPFAIIETLAGESFYGVSVRPDISGELAA
jgi:hypothetical protein